MTMARTPEKVVVVGAGHVGGLIARDVAARGDCRVTLIGREALTPYERPPLSKGVLFGDAAPEDASILTVEQAARLGIDLKLGREVVAIDRERQNVICADGLPVPYDALVLATGGRCRRLSVPGGDLAGIHYLRDAADALRLRAAMDAGGPLVVVGAGFIGLEVTAAARRRGIPVTVVEATPQVLSRAVPRRIADRIADRHRGEGVDLRLEARTVSIEGGGDGQVAGLTLGDGSTLPCRSLLVAVGIDPEVSLADAAGLAVADGIVTDAAMRTSDPVIYAAGDSACFRSPLYGRALRLESWRNAQDHAAVIIDRLGGGDAVCEAAPWVWSDQYDWTLTLAGLPADGTATITRSGADGTELHFHLDTDGVLVGASAWAPTGAAFRDMRIAQMLIERRACPDRAALADRESRLKRLLAA
ncbi:NAD(P)/FAD-dependent oxidoreductase [Thalassobaculum sp.]|uniref:NAD(P)/FAD-dependent oxidoreductase n=1 Tax=Thalassobaculum sp. TaxID=2022740 RepID=UPI003B5ADCBD